MGISEDPFTGSVLGGLVRFLQHYLLIDANQKVLTVKQGHFIDRPGSVDVEIDDEVIRVHAKAKNFFSTYVKL